MELLHSLTYSLSVIQCYIYLSLSLSLSLCVCVCVCERERERNKADVLSCQLRSIENSDELHTIKLKQCQNVMFSLMVYICFIQLQYVSNNVRVVSMVFHCLGYVSHMLFILLICSSAYL